MPKLNVVLMVALAAAVIAVTGFLVLRSSSAQDEAPAQAAKWIRKLADQDPDLRREGEEGLRRMGSLAAAPLREASRSSDRTLAGRAARLLQELGPVPGSPVQAASDLPSETLDFTLKGSGVPESPSRYGSFMVEVGNRSPGPVVLSLGASDSPWQPGWFEVEDERGQVERVVAFPLHSSEKESLVILGPGERRMLFRGGPELLSALGKPPSRSVRFVYDASSAEYRKGAGKSDAGSLLPVGKHASKGFPLAETR